MEPLAKDLICDDEHAMAMITDLKKQVDQMKTKYETLEEECDLLAMDNDRLRNLCQENNVNPDSPLNNTEEKNKATSGVEVGAVHGANMVESEEFLVNAGGDGQFACTVGREIKDACGTGNVLCVEYLQLPDDLETGEYVLCGGVDKTLRLYSLSSGEMIFQHVMDAPILAIDSMGAMVACSMMDGSHAVINLCVQSSSELGGSFSPEVVQSQRDHTKYAVSVQWSPCGDFLVTASHDKTVVLYEKDVSGGGADGSPVRVSMKLKHRLTLKEVAEGAIFCKLPADFTGSDDSRGGDEEQLHLVVPTRGQSHLMYISCHSLRHKKVSLNENSWDSHCSFNVLHLSLSPCGQQLLVATDKDFHIILKTGTNQRLGLLAGHMCNEYGKPKTAWDVTGKYVYSNNQADHDILVYEVNTGKIAGTLSGHKGQVRDIKSHSGRRVLTASYDHTVKEWVRA